MDPSRELIMKIVLGGSFILPGIFIIQAGLQYIRGPRRWQKAVGIMAILLGLPGVLFGILVVGWARIY